MSHEGKHQCLPSFFYCATMRLRCFFQSVENCELTRLINFVLKSARTGHLVFNVTGNNLQRIEKPLTDAGNPQPHKIFSLKCHY